MQEFRHSKRPSENSLQRLVAGSDDSTPRSYSGSGLSRTASGNARDNSGQIEAILKAQVLELRRDLASSQQAAQSAQQDLQRKGSLIRTAAGEARKEVLSLRSEKDQLTSELAEARNEVQYLHEEIGRLQVKLATASGQEEDNTDIEDLKRSLGEAESELEDLRSNERVSDATKEAMRAQLTQLIVELEEHKRQLKELQDQGESQQEQPETKVHTDQRKELDLLKHEYHQAMTRVEALQNELDVTIEESSQDRLSAAATILDLQSKLASHSPLKLYDSSPRSDSSPRHSPGLKALLSPDHNQAYGGAARSFCRKKLLENANGYSISSNLENGQSDDDDDLRSEIQAAGSYLQDLSTRLQDTSLDLRNLVDEKGGLHFHDDVLVLKQAVERLEQRVKLLDTSEDSVGAESVKAQTSSPAAQQIVLKPFPQRLSTRIIGGVILAPVIVAAAIFLPIRKRISSS